MYCSATRAGTIYNYKLEEIMSYNVRRVLAIIFIIIIAFGWVVTVKGIGPMTPIKDRMGLGLDIKGGVYVVLEADPEELDDMDFPPVNQENSSPRTLIHDP